MALLPHDILREIGAYWNGHRLLYTCTALYTWWNPDDHVITERRTVSNKLTQGVRTRITISRMPNGAYHGKCDNTRSYSDTVSGSEIIEYDRGRAVSTTCCTDQYYRVVTIINGWRCCWVNNRAGLNDARGIVYVGNTLPTQWHNRAHREGVALSDFIAVASELLARTSEHGGLSELVVLHDWGAPMPGTIH